MMLPISGLPVAPRPDFRWPGGRRMALWVAVGVESYRPDEGRTEDILPRSAAPDHVNAAWRAYGNRVGAMRLFERLSGAGIVPTVLLNTDVYDEAPEVIAAARRTGAEIVAHGLSNSDCLADMGAEEELAYLRRTRDRIAAEEGTAPRGWSSPWLAHGARTLPNLARAGFDILLDLRMDDRPVTLDTGAGPLLAVPYAAELNDSTTMIGRQVTARAFAGMIADEAEELLRNPDGPPVVMSVVLHSFISGQPFRAGPVCDALAGLARRGSEVWCATPSRIADAWHGAG